MTKDDLIGCDYPVKNEHNVIVGSRKITKSFDMENQAAYGVCLDNHNDSIVLVSLAAAIRLVNEKQNNSPS